MNNPDTICAIATAQGGAIGLIREMNNPDTICAIATAQGGAIGLIRVSGPDAIAFTDRIFTPVSSSVPLTQRKPYTLTFGHIKNAKGEIIDEVLISVFRAPHSYTGEDSTEIS